MYQVPCVSMRHVRIKFWSSPSPFSCAPARIRKRAKPAVKDSMAVWGEPWLMAGHAIWNILRSSIVNALKSISLRGFNIIKFYSVTFSWGWKGRWLLHTHIIHHQNLSIWRPKRDTNKPSHLVTWCNLPSFLLDESCYLFFFELPCLSSSLKPPKSTKRKSDFDVQIPLSFWLWFSHRHVIVKASLNRKYVEIQGSTGPCAGQEAEPGLDPKVERISFWWLKPITSCNSIINHILWYINHIITHIITVRCFVWEFGGKQQE